MVQISSKGVEVPPPLIEYVPLCMIESRGELMTKIWLREPWRPPNPMSIMALNYRRVGGDATFKDLRRLVRREHPNFLCIVVAQVSKVRVEDLPATLGMIDVLQLKVEA